MRGRGRFGAFVMILGMGGGCAKAPARHCEAFDEAQSLFASVSGQTLDPSFEDPRYAPVAAAFEAIPEDCARYETAAVTAENIRNGLAKGRANARRPAAPPPAAYVPPPSARRPEVVFPPPAEAPAPAAAEAPKSDGWEAFSPQEDAAAFAELEQVVNELERRAPGEEAFFDKIRECLDRSRGLYMPCMKRCKESGKAYADCSKTCRERVEVWMDRRGCSEDKLLALVKQQR